jgi:hypothetical protein
MHAIKNNLVALDKCHKTINRKRHDMTMKLNVVTNLITKLEFLIHCHE